MLWCWPWLPPCYSSSRATCFRRSRSEMPRARSESAHQKVIHAALELVAERGMEATSMDAIAARSGVSKATIYKHWADKDALLLEVIASIHGLHTRPKFDSGNTRADIVAVLSYQPKDDIGMRERI